MLVYCQIISQKAAAMLLQIAASTLSDTLHRAVKRARENHRIRNLKTIGIDEISYCKGHKYATIVYDLKKARVVWAGRGKGRATTINPLPKRSAITKSARSDGRPVI